MAKTRLSTIVMATAAVYCLFAASIQAAKPAKPPKPAKPVSGKVNVLAGATLAVPSGCGVKVRWVCPPMSEKAVEDAHWYDLRFVVDSKGLPWFSADYNHIINPTKQYQFALQQSPDDIACLGNGMFLVATVSDLGLVTPPETPKTDYDGYPVALFQPIAGLPIPGCKLFPGAGNCLYIAGWNNASEKFEVYLLQREKLTTGGSSVRQYVKVFSSDKEISAVAGDGNVAYVAVERVIIKVTRSSAAPAKVYIDPKGTVRGLAYSPQTGLFYSTYDGVGYIGTNGPMQILAAEDTQIYLQNGSLYVLLAKSMGVVALDNIGGLKKVCQAIKAAPATPSKEIKVTNIRFFEAGETAPEYADRKYVKEFEKASARYIYCQLDMNNLLKGKRVHKQIISMDLAWPGGASYSDTAETTVEFKPDYNDVAAWLRFGSNAPAGFYPGVYTLKTYLNGAKIDERQFTVKGDATVVEAAWASDSARLWKLLDGGADANAVDSEGQPALVFAVTQGSIENVRLLLDHKANVDAKDKDGYTPLLTASGWYQDNTAMVQLLLDRGADANAADSDGQTSLYRAVGNNQLGVIRVLLEHKANPNVRDKNGRTPISAFNYGMGKTQYRADPKCLKYLLNHGADPNIASNDGRTVLEQAISGPDFDLAQILIEHGANVNAEVKYTNGEVHSLLFWAIIGHQIESDRVDREAQSKIIRMLIDKGAKLRYDELQHAFTQRWDKMFTRKQIVAMLETNNQAVFVYVPDDLWLRKYVLRRIIGLAQSNISNAIDTSYYDAALNCSVLAKDRAETWGLAASYPEVYFNCGMLASKMGQRDNARTWLQKYLSLAPNGTKSISARNLLSSL